MVFHPVLCLESEAKGMCAMMEKAMEKDVLGVITGNRRFFNPKLAEEGRKELLKVLDNANYKYCTLSDTDTNLGVVSTIEDAKICAKLFQDNKEKIAGIIVSLPNYGDEVAIVNAIKLSNLNVPILLQALEDDLDKLDIFNRRDAYCGKLSVSNNLFQNSIPFTDTKEHVIKLSSPVFKEDLEYFKKVCNIVNGLRDSRIGVIGTRPANFQTVRASEKILQDSNITVIPVDLSEIIFNAIKLKDSDKKVIDQIDELSSYGRIPENIKKENILKQSKLSVAVNNWVKENEVDAVAMQCWTSIQENYGCAACATLSMLSDKLIPGACEADITGAISMYILSLATGNPPALVDWNNNYGSEKDKVVVTHCSNYPKGFVGREIEISNLDGIGNTLGEDICFGAIKGIVVPGPMTFLRVDTNDLKGEIRGYLGGGEFTDDSCTIAGGVAVCKIDNLREVISYICNTGFPHHCGMVRSDCVDVITHTLKTYFNWNIKSL